MRPTGGDVDPITGRMESVGRALLAGRAGAARHGVAVEVGADGTLAAVRIDESITPYGAYLGQLIADLAREALERARAQVLEQLDEFMADPRIMAACDALESAVQQPKPVEPLWNQQPQPNPGAPAWNQQPQANPVAPVRNRRPFDEDLLSEEELIEENERYNRSLWS
ncbi:hypothetical protein [Nocardia stercoris]|uniref:Uncharacterized protein n=1 Tax=Nocardia stercoris TaxID=2483361 RepID=A0A3M2L3L9_9NOCA|nr:hypothetical protein [Nocardia stercoris]RMI32247.1 hypothetical protein EBN03_14755 [Nocardia stercoris]